MSLIASDHFRIVVGLGAAIFLYMTAATPVETTLILPMLKDHSIPLGIGFVVLTYFVIVGSSNAVNLTDGLDGLAIMPTVICLLYTSPSPRDS